MRTKTEQDRIKIALIVLASLVALLVPGIINLKIAHAQPSVLESMLLGSTGGLPVYFNRFIFPMSIELPTNMVQSAYFTDQISFFPPHTKIIKATDKNVYGSDTITIEYSGNDALSVFSCSGRLLTPRDVVRSTYFIDASANLACLDVTDDTATMFKTPKILIKNIDSMRILYGFDKDRNQAADIYLSAEDPKFSINSIISARINLLLRTYNKEAARVRYYTLGNQKVGPYADGYTRRVLTIFLTNQ